MAIPRQVLRRVPQLSELAADLAFDSMSPDEIADHAEAWEKVVRKLRGRMMPPPGGNHPEGPEIDAFVAWLEANLDQGSPEQHAGYVPLHRLNRTEYANAINDLLALDVDPTTLLPVDGAEDGFDNVANALVVSPSFIDQYLTAARTLSAQAVGNPAPRAAGVPYTIADPRGQQFHVEGLPLGTRGGTVIEHYFPSDGDYLLNIGDLVTGLWGYNQEHENTLIATLDGRKFFELDIGGGEDLKELDQIGAPAVDKINARLKNIPFTTTAGVHKVGVTFLHRSFAESDRHLQALVPGGGQDAVLTLNLVEIFGPVAPTRIEQHAQPRQDFQLLSGGASRRGCVRRERSSPISRSSVPRPVSDEDMRSSCGSTSSARSNGGFEEGIKYALSGVLAAPEVSLPLRVAARRSRARRSVRTRAASSLLRGCRSSCGARPR